MEEGLVSVPDSKKATVDLRTDGPVRIITINRPECRNRNRRR